MADESQHSLFMSDLAPKYKYVSFFLEVDENLRKSGNKSMMFIGRFVREYMQKHPEFSTDQLVADLEKISSYCQIIDSNFAIIPTKVRYKMYLHSRIEMADQTCFDGVWKWEIISPPYQKGFPDFRYTRMIDNSWQLEQKQIFLAQQARKVFIRELNLSEKDAKETYEDLTTAL
ncbi:hypothetical protein AGMMS50249_4610 [candidate division SR1 bacterium]|nr:hypothetical protein AGMMS50249_4610 [candidate division SR1 bacterium]